MISEDDEFQRIAEEIDTGIDNPDASRALIVFNKSAQFFAGTVVMRVDMPWGALDLPPISVARLRSGDSCASVVKDLVYTDAGFDGRRRVRFDLAFTGAAIAAWGWDTYIASYRKNGFLPAQVGLGGEITRDQYELVETTRHKGRLSPCGNLLAYRAMSVRRLTGS